MSSQVIISIFFIILMCNIQMSFGKKSLKEKPVSNINISFKGNGRWNSKYFMYNDIRKTYTEITGETKKITADDGKNEKREKYEILKKKESIRDENVNDIDATLFKRSDEATTKNVDNNDYNEILCLSDPVLCNETKERYLEKSHEYVYPISYETVLIVVYVLVFVSGLIGNVLVCVALYQKKSMRNVANYCLLNLAVADFLIILLCLPPIILFAVTKIWFFGATSCGILLYLQSVSDTVSVLTLTFISLDRWCTICYPLKFKSTTSRAKTAILIIWLVSVIFNIPEFVILEVQTNIELRFHQQYFMQCTYGWSEEGELTWQLIRALFLYTLPLMLMMVAYWQIVRVLWRSDNISGQMELHQLRANVQTNGFANRRQRIALIHANASTNRQLRSHREAAKMLITVVIMFAMCFFPVHLLCVLRFAYNIQHSDMMTAVALISHVMCYVNAAVNPFIYNFMCGKYRHQFYRSYCKCFRCCIRSDNITAPGSLRTCNTHPTASRSDTCLGYRQSHRPISNLTSVHRDLGEMNTSFTKHKRGG